MYILSQNKLLTVNSTILSSINIEKIEWDDPDMIKKYPDAHKIVAYGKGEKVYLLGIYDGKKSAEWKLSWLHEAMKENQKTFEF